MRTLAKTVNLVASLNKVVRAVDTIRKLNNVVRMRAMLSFAKLQSLHNFEF